MISGEKILVTGVSGTVAGPLARSLAADNEVWGLARFADGTARQELEDAGITTHAVDLGTDSRTISPTCCTLRGPGPT
jgi:nucleoside-diphosphate-sugar epimerase